MKTGLFFLQCVIIVPMEKQNRLYDYIIFDFDGTLADSGPISLKAIKSMAQKYGFRDIEWNDVNKMRGMSFSDRCKYMGVSPLKIPIFVSDFYSYYKTHIDELELNKGIGELTHTLHDEGFGLAVLSSNSENNIKHFFEINNINIFNDIICSNHLFSKDIMINKYIRRKKLNKNKVLYVGDELRDIEACKKAGIDIVWVDWGLDMRSTVEPSRPNYIVSDPNEIYKIIYGRK